MRHALGTQHRIDEIEPLGGLAYTDEEKHLFSLVTGFMRTKILVAAIRFELFDFLSVRPRSREDLQLQLGLSDRSLDVFLDCLLALKLIGVNEKGKYLNTGIGSKYLVKGKLSYIGGSFELFNSVYGECNDLVELLRNGGGHNRRYAYIFRNLSDLQPEDVEECTRQMDETSAHPVMTLMEFHDFEESRVVLDLGGGTGKICRTLVSQYPHIQTILFDLPAVCEKAKEALQGFWLRHRIRITPGDFFTDDLPKGFDTAVLMRVTEDWGAEKVKALFRKIHDSLPPGGKIIIYEPFREDDPKRPGDAALVSLLLFLNTTEGICRSKQQLIDMLQEVGFRDIESFHTIYIYSAIVGTRR